MEERELKYLLSAEIFYDVVEQIKKIFPNVSRYSTAH
jgi:hypothetical protein